MTSTPRRIPVLISFTPASGKFPAWGHISELSPGAARLCARAPIHCGEALTLAFELAGESFAAPGKACDCDHDADDYCLVEVRFTDELSRRRLARHLLSLTSGSEKDGR